MRKKDRVKIFPEPSGNHETWKLEGWIAMKYPILEYDKTRQALIEPSRLLVESRWEDGISPHLLRLGNN